MILLHATSAVICLVAGLALLSPRRARRRPILARLFIGSLIGMILFMITATISHWYDISITERIVFAGLPVLGIYMLYRGVVALKKLKSGADADYINDVGFTLISLFNGFIIVALIDLNAHPILVPAAAIAGTVAGGKYIEHVRLKHRIQHTQGVSR